MKKRWRVSLTIAAVIAILFSIRIGIDPTIKSQGEQPNLQRMLAYEKWKNQFKLKCKEAGEQIHRTVDSVEGVLLLRIRDLESWRQQQYSQDWPDAGLPRERLGEDYIRSFLLNEHPLEGPSRRGILRGERAENSSPGYEFVDIQQAGTIERYRLSPDFPYSLVSVGNPANPARYAVTFYNDIDQGTREGWIAGTRVEVIDTRDRKVIASKSWYAFDPGLGDQMGGRQPWAFAEQCPEHQGAYRGAQTRMFVDTVLKPRRRPDVK
jgi:hypothetical protein